jgi:hypothetical protein
MTAIDKQLQAGQGGIDREAELRSGFDRYSLHDLGDPRLGSDDELYPCRCGKFETMGGRPCSECAR